MKKAKLYFFILIGLFFFSIIPLNSIFFTEKEFKPLKDGQETLKTAESGGGYIMDDTATFNWIDITQTGINMTQISDSNDNYQTLYFSSHGWSFEFYETFYDKLYVSTEGWISFSGDGWVGSEIWQIPSLEDRNNDAAVLLSDWQLDPSVGGNIYYEFRGSSPNRYLVIQYHQIHTESGQVLGDFEAIFYEDGTIKFQYLNVYDVTNNYDLCIGLDHGDSVNYNKYDAPELPINKLAIEFLFNQMEEVKFDLAEIEGEEYQWITTQINYDQIKIFLGNNWEQLFGFYTEPKRGLKIKKFVSSITEYSETNEINYYYWDWIDRRLKFSDTATINDALTYKKDPADYNKKHNLTHILPFVIPTPVDAFMGQANLTNNYKVWFDDWKNLTHVEFNVGKHIDGHWLNLNIKGYYTIQGVLERMEFTHWNETTSKDTTVLIMESFDESYLRQFKLKLYKLMDYKWRVDEINTSELEFVFGEDWEQIFGLPANPQLNEKMQIKVDDIKETRDKWEIYYSIWDWQRSESFAGTGDQNKTMEYFKDPFNYKEVHLLPDVFPPFIPSPSKTYLPAAYLNRTIYRDIDFEEYDNSSHLRTWIRQNINGREFELNMFAGYNLDGVRFYLDLKLRDHETNDETVLLRLHLFDYDDRPPDLWVERPNSHERFGTTPPNFTLYVEDQHLEDIWYSLDGGQTNILCERSGQVKEELWTRLEDGEVTITFYANDQFYRKSTVEVRIIKDSSMSRSNEFDIFQSIPGYDITVLIAFLSIGAVLITWRIKKNKQS